MEYHQLTAHSVLKCFGRARAWSGRDPTPRCPGEIQPDSPPDGLGKNRARLPKGWAIPEPDKMAQLGTTRGQLPGFCIEHVML